MIRRFLEWLFGPDKLYEEARVMRLLWLGRHPEIEERDEGTIVRWRNDRL